MPLQLPTHAHGSKLRHGQPATLKPQQAAAAANAARQRTEHRSGYRPPPRGSRAACCCPLAWSTGTLSSCTLEAQPFVSPAQATQPLPASSAHRTLQASRSNPRLAAASHRQHAPPRAGAVDRQYLHCRRPFLRYFHPTHARPKGSRWPALAPAGPCHAIASICSCTRRNVHFPGGPPASTVCSNKHPAIQSIPAARCARPRQHAHQVLKHPTAGSHQLPMLPLLQSSALMNAGQRPFQR